MARFTAGDGCEIAYRDEGAGRAILFVHGLSASAAAFDPQAVALADRFRIVRIDLRGHGDTPACGLLSLDRCAADVGELTRLLDIRDAVVVGWSLGAMLAWDVLLSAEAPRFAGLVTIDMTPRVENDDAWTLGLIEDGFRAQRGSESWAQRCCRVAGAIVADGIANAALVDRLAAMLGASDPTAVIELGAAMMLRDYRALLPRIATPTLVVHGARSLYYAPATSGFIADAMADARAVPFARSGHAPHLEEPEAFNRLLADFAACPRT